MSASAKSKHIRWEHSSGGGRLRNPCFSTVPRTAGNLSLFNGFPAYCHFLASFDLDPATTKIPAQGWTTARKNRKGVWAACGSRMLVVPMKLVRFFTGVHCTRLVELSMPIMR